MTDRLVAHWPLFGLRLRIGDIELRPLADDDLAELVEVASAGVHAPETMPFLVPWTDKTSPDFERGILQYHWRSRATWSPSMWTLDFAVRRGGQLVGSQGIAAEDFAVRRTVETGSWLGQSFQGQGIGTAMRVAVLTLAFDGLGALEATSGAFTDNPQSAAVSRKLGYTDDGHRVHVRRGDRAVEERFALHRDAWYARDRPAVEITGLQPCLEMFGAT